MAETTLTPETPPPISDQRVGAKDPLPRKPSILERLDILESAFRQHGEEDIGYRSNIEERLGNIESLLGL